MGGDGMGGEEGEGGDERREKMRVKIRATESM